MTKVVFTRTVRCTPEQAFAIVADVPSYRLFLPLVRESRMTKPVGDPDGVQEAQAKLQIAGPRFGLDLALTSTVVFENKDRIIRISSHEGPVHHMYGTWSFEAAGENTTRVTLDVDVRLRSFMLQTLLSGGMDFILRRLFSAFEARVHALYGQKLSGPATIIPQES